MLLRLEFTQLATFAGASLELAHGLNVLSGASGAGKTVVLKALELALGGRFAAKFLREGAEEARVAALFALPEAILGRWREELNLEDGEVLIERRFRKDGRGVSQVNGRAVSADQVRRLGRDLAQVLSQDEAMGLRDTEVQLGLLDAYAGLEKKLAGYIAAYGEWRAAEKELAATRERRHSEGLEREMLAFQIEELRRLAPRRGEEQEIAEEYKTLAHAGELAEAGRELVSGARDFAGVMKDGLKVLDERAGEGGDIARLAAEGRDLALTLEEWARALSMATGDLAAQPQRLEELGARLAGLRAAFKKFRRGEDELCAYFEDLQRRAGGEDGEQELAKLEKQAKELATRSRALGEALHEDRLKAAPRLAREVNRLLGKLDMEGGRFSVRLERCEPGPRGLSAAAFELKPNPEATARPLGEVASGGERARALLALCAAVSGSLDTPLIVLDEIDTSMGSRLGRPVAECLQRLAEHRQVLCVTHLAPVAAGGACHYLVEKKGAGSNARRLMQAERLSEVAQMIAGQKDSPIALEQARELLGAARD